MEFPLKKRVDVIKSSKDWKDLILQAKLKLTKAYKLLYQGIIDEASEEAWKSVVDSINALCIALWSYEVKSEYALSSIVGKLKELNIVDVTTEFGNAFSLHTNYYNSRFDKYIVEANIKQVEKLITKIEKVIERFMQRHN